ncbi:MAG: TraB/GumN family protein [Proteobacteria bacterium]|nr:TraB/GumN family protein [Pseudomonadota bacterium]
MKTALNLHRTIGTFLASLLVIAVFLATPAQADGPASPALWKLSDEDSDVWLFGTIHVLNPEISWHSENVNAAFNEADILILEADVAGTASAEMQQMVMKFARNPAGVTLSSLLSKEGNTRFIQALISIGVPEKQAYVVKQQMEPLRPWLVGAQLANMQIQSRGADASSGVETILIEAAKDAKKPLQYFETIEQQIRVFADLSQEKETQMLEESLIQLLEQPDMLDTLVKDWLVGNAEEVGAMLQSAIDDPELYEALLTSRNQNWAHQIKTIMDGSGRYFIAVGTGHLVGKGSVQDYLRAQGLTVVRVQ